MRAVIEYKEAYRGYLNLYAGNVIHGTGISLWNNNTVNGKVAFFDNEDDVEDNEAWKKIESKSCYSVRVPQNGEERSLFVSPKSKIPRDTLRNSGYKIVLDPDKADYVVMPRVYYNFDSTAFHVLVYNTEFQRLYFFHIDKRGYESFSEDNDNTELFRAIEAHIKENVLNNAEGLLFWMREDLEPINIIFVPRVQEYIDILSGTYPARKYVLDDRVDVVPSVGIDVETLVTWQMCRDKDLLAKAVVNSDYMHYPITIACFLAAEKRFDVDRIQNAQFRRVLEIIHYNYIRNASKMDLPVDKQDFDMLQKWIMYKLGVSEKGGWVSNKQLEDLDSVYEQFVMTRMAVAPFSFDTFTSSMEIMKEIQNIL